MNYIVLDLEWNQRLRGQKKITEPVRLRGEIIQIGAVRLDESYSVTDTFRIMISPVYYREMHQMVSEITNIPQRTLREVCPFPRLLKGSGNGAVRSLRFLSGV